MSPVAAHAAEHVVVVVGADLQRLLGEDDLARRDVPRGHHVPPEPAEDTLYRKEKKIKEKRKESNGDMF